MTASMVFYAPNRVTHPGVNNQPYAAVIAFFFASLAWYVHSPSILTGCVLGFAGYWSGTGLQHTANHGGLCQNAKWNQVWGWFGCDVLLGKSSLEWRYHHMVSHHSYCNDHEMDQDVYTSFPIMRLDDSQEWSWFHKVGLYELNPVAVQAESSGHIA
jgi:fatty acid desaturase (delta-4 desaturase)